MPPIPARPPTSARNRTASATGSITTAISYTTGKHDIKFGSELVHVTNAFLSGTSGDGHFSFVGTYSGNGMADFLLGLPGQCAPAADALNLWGAHGSFWGYYFQDNYRITQNLTLNLGARWEINPFYNGVQGQITRIRLRNGKVILPTGFRNYVRNLTFPNCTLYSRTGSS